MLRMQSSCLVSLENFGNVELSSSLPQTGYAPPLYVTLHAPADTQGSTATWRTVSGRDQPNVLSSLHRAPPAPMRGRLDRLRHRSSPQLQSSQGRLFSSPRRVWRHAIASVTIRFSHLHSCHVQQLQASAREGLCFSSWRASLLASHPRNDGSATSGAPGERWRLQVRSPDTLGFCVRLDARSRSPALNRFTFSELCRADVFAADYQAICERFHTIVLEDVPRMSAEVMYKTCLRYTHRLISCVPVLRSIMRPGDSSLSLTCSTSPA
jgi:hypothetical protein